MQAKSIKGKSPEEIKDALQHEFGRATNGNNAFHNQTCCWVALKEK